MKYSSLEKLPTDRAYLHFEAVRVEPEQVQVDYELVIPLGELDCRGTYDHKGTVRPKSHRMVWLDKQNNKRIPLGRTMIGTGRKDYPFDSRWPGEIDMPFRDGAHARWDNEKLGGLSLIYTVGDKHYTLIKPEKIEEKA